GSAADIGVFAQDAAQVATVLLGRVAQQIVDQVKGGVLQSVALHAAVDAVVGLTQGPRPEDFRGLQALISEAANQEDSQHERRRIMRPPRAQAVQASGEENPEDQGAGTLQYTIPVAAMVVAFWSLPAPGWTVFSCCLRKGRSSEPANRVRAAARQAA